MHNLSKLYHEVKVVAAAEAQAAKQESSAMTSSQRVHIAMVGAGEGVWVRDAACASRWAPTLHTPDPRARRPTR